MKHLKHILLSSFLAIHSAQTAEARGYERDANKNVNVPTGYNYATGQYNSIKANCGNSVTPEGQIKESFALKYHKAVCGNTNETYEQRLKQIKSKKYQLFFDGLIQRCER